MTGYQKLASAVIEQALEDVAVGEGWDFKEAIDFVFAEDRRSVAVRTFWLLLANRELRDLQERAYDIIDGEVKLVIDPKNRSRTWVKGGEA